MHAQLFAETKHDNVCGYGTGAYRILVVLTQRNMEKILTDFAKIFACSQECEIGFLYDYSSENMNKEACDDYIPVSKKRHVIFNQFGLNCDIESKLIRVGGIWPFKMILVSWPDSDSRFGMIMRAARLMNSTSVFVRRNIDNVPIKRVLVPAGGGIHAFEGVRIADILAKALNVPAMLLRIIDLDEHLLNSKMNLQKKFRCIKKATQLYLDVADVSMPVILRAGNDIVREIVTHSRASDIIILGGSTPWLMENNASMSIPCIAAGEFPGTVLMVMTNGCKKVTLSNVFWERTIYTGLQAKSKISAITSLVDALIYARQIPFQRRNEILHAVMAREKSGCTYIGNSTAIPHAAIKGFAGITGVLGIFPKGVRFGKENDELANFIFLLLTPKENYDSYIPILSQIAQLMHEPSRRNALLSAVKAGDITALIRDSEDEWLQS